MRQSFVIHRNTGLVTLDIIGGKGEDIVLLECNLSVFKGFYAVFGSLCVKHYRNRKP